MEAVIIFNNGVKETSFKVTGVSDLKKLKSDLIDFVELDVNIYIKPTEEEEEREELMYFENFGTYGNDPSGKIDVFFRGSKGGLYRCVMNLHVINSRESQIILQNSKENGFNVQSLKRAYYNLGQDLEFYAVNK